MQIKCQVFCYKIFSKKDFLFHVDCKHSMNLRMFKNFQNNLQISIDFQHLTFIQQSYALYSKTTTIFICSWRNLNWSIWPCVFKSCISALKTYTFCNISIICKIFVATLIVLFAGCRLSSYHELNCSSHFEKKRKLRFNFVGLLNSASSCLAYAE